MINEECLKLKGRKDDIGREQRYIECSIRDVSSEIDDLEHQNLDLDLRLRQASNERVRLDLELLKFMKLGKQPKMTTTI